MWVVAAILLRVRSDLRVRWRAWVFLAVMFLTMTATGAWLYVHNKVLLEERLAPLVQREQPRADKIVLLLFLVFYAGSVLFIPLDVFRLKLLDKPAGVVSTLGLVLLGLGTWVIFRAMKDNTFATPVIKHQEDREHRVVDTGIYGVVRHPMYAGFIPMAIGAALWLESYAAAALMALPVSALVARIVIEEAFLRRELPGYEAYSHKVRYRLIPFVW